MTHGVKNLVFLVLTSFFSFYFQDPLMRRIEGSPMIPPSALLHSEIPIRRKNRLLEWMNTFQFRAKKIDVISRVIFPLTFLLFNVIYWSYYLSQEHKSNSNK